MKKEVSLLITRTKGVKMSLQKVIEVECDEKATNTEIIDTASLEFLNTYLKNGGLSPTGDIKIAKSKAGLKIKAEIL